MTSGGNNCNYFAENQLTKLKLCPPTSLFLPPENFCDAFCVAGMPLDAPADTKCLLSSQKTMFMVLFHCRTVARVHSVLVVNAEQRDVTADLWTKSTGLSERDS